MVTICDHCTLLHLMQIVVKSIQFVNLFAEKMMITSNMAVIHAVIEL